MVRSSSRELWRARKRTLRELRQASFLVSYRTLAFIDAKRRIARTANRWLSRTGIYHR